MGTKVNLSLEFKVQKTSNGYLAQGMEIPAIIIESTNKKELLKDLDAAAKCYFKSFPEQLGKFVLKEEEEIEKLDITI
jgi:hypothetical protein